MSLTFIGIGLSVRGLTIEGLLEARKSKYVFLDSYTSLLPPSGLLTLQSLIGKEIKRLRRSDLEGRGSQTLLELAERDDVALLVVGDPFIATTHITLKLEAIKRGVHVKYIPSASILSVIPGLTGLSSYKFGRSATVVYPEKGSNDTAYDTVKDNKQRGLHTLLYLDLDDEEGRAMTANEALRLLVEVEDRRRENVFKSDTLIVGVARACWDDCLVKASTLSKLLYYDFGPPPHIIVVPGPLHFVEHEALKLLAGMEDES